MLMSPYFYDYINHVFTVFYTEVVLVVKNPPTNAGRCQRQAFDIWVRKIPWMRTWQPTPVYMTGKSHGKRSLMAMVHRVAKSQTQLKEFGRHTHI